MNIYEFIKYRILRMRRPEEFKIGQVWEDNGPDPFKRTHIIIVDIKDSYVQFIYENGTGSKYSFSMDFVRSTYKLLNP